MILKYYILTSFIDELNLYFVLFSVETIDYAKKYRIAVRFVPNEAIVEVDQVIGLLATNEKMVKKLLDHFSKIATAKYNEKQQKIERELRAEEERRKEEEEKRRLEKEMIEKERLKSKQELDEIIASSSQLLEAEEDLPSLETSNKNEAKDVSSFMNDEEVKNDDSLISENREEENEVDVGVKNEDSILADIKKEEDYVGHISENREEENEVDVGVINEDSILADIKKEEDDVGNVEVSFEVSNKDNLSNENEALMQRKIYIDLASQPQNDNCAPFLKLNSPESTRSDATTSIMQNLSTTESNLSLTYISSTPNILVPPQTGFQGNKEMENKFRVLLAGSQKEYSLLVGYRGYRVANQETCIGMYCQSQLLLCDLMKQKYCVVCGMYDVLAYDS